MQTNAQEDRSLARESEGCYADVSKLADQETMEAMKASIITKIKEVHVDVKREVGEAAGLLKKEISDFREEMNEKLSVIDTDLKEMAQRIEETERRVSEMEELCMDVKEVLFHTLELQEHLRARLIDLEARSRRNNVHIYGIPEGAEGNNILEFTDNFIKTELGLPDTPLGIQRCHHLLGPKPLQESNPRSVVIGFLEFKTRACPPVRIDKKRHSV